MIRVLAVDDADDLREYFAGALRRAGFEVTEAADGQQALELARAQSFALVLTDQYMPRLDGISLVRALRSLPSYRTAPILVVTAESRAEVKRRGREAGVSGWIVKPVGAAPLVDIVSRLTGAPPPAQAGLPRGSRGAGTR